MGKNKANLSVPSPEFIEEALEWHSKEAKIKRQEARMWGAATLFALGVSFGGLVEGDPVLAIGGSVVSIMAGLFYGDGVADVKREEKAVEIIERTALNELYKQSN